MKERAEAAAETSTHQMAAASVWLSTDVQGQMPSVSCLKRTVQLVRQNTVCMKLHQIPFHWRAADTRSVSSDRCGIAVQGLRESLFGLQRFLVWTLMNCRGGFTVQTLTTFWLWQRFDSDNILTRSILPCNIFVCDILTWYALVPLGIPLHILSPSDGWTTETKGVPLGQQKLRELHLDNRN